MASVVDICNMALASIGARADVTSIDPPEASVEAELCARFYPMARDAMLAMHRWSFATRRATLADLSATYTPASPWGFTYAVPSEAKEVIGVYDPSAAFDEDVSSFVMESASDGTRVIYTDVEDAVIRYTALVTDTGAFPPLFETALAWMLASYLAGPIIKGVEGIKIADGARNTALGFATRAWETDARQSQMKEVRLDSRHQAPWITARS